MIDLSTNYLGMILKNPLVASASPLSESVDRIRQLEDGGVAAVVLPSLFEEQLDVESLRLDGDLYRGSESFAESLSYLPELQDYNLGPDGYLELIRRAREVASVPIIASLNGASMGGWVRYARLMEEAGAHALELNLYALPTGADRTGMQVEQDYCDLVRQVRQRVRIPLAVKLSHFFSAPANMARRLEEAGAGALVLFNRFYQPDFDIDRLEVVPRLALSHPYELLLRLHWVAILYGQVKADLAITGGVHGPEDVLKCMMAGARVAMMTSALLENGPDHAARVLRDVEYWMEEHEYLSIQQMQGSMSQQAVPDPAAFERGNYMRVLSSYTLRPELASTDD